MFCSSCTASHRFLIWNYSRARNFMFSLSYSATFWVKDFSFVVVLFTYSAKDSKASVVTPAFTFNWVKHNYIIFHFKKEKMFLLVMMTSLNYTVNLSIVCNNLSYFLQKYHVNALNKFKTELLLHTNKWQKKLRMYFFLTVVLF